MKSLRTSVGSRTLVIAIPRPTRIVPIIRSSKPKSTRATRAISKTVKTISMVTLRPSLRVNQGLRNAPRPKQNTGIDVRRLCCEAFKLRLRAISCNSGPIAARGGRSRCRGKGRKS